MKAAQINKYGGKDVVEINPNAKKPEIGNNQILVKVEAAAVNPFDVTVREGLARQMAELDFPATLGGDFAGTVVELGVEVKNFEEGQKVYGQASPLSGNGSFAEYVPVNSSQAQLAPQSIDLYKAAALPLASVSSYQAIVDSINLQPNQKILIHGGAGGIGTYAIQIAKNIGAHVATTVSTNDIEFVKNLGADEVIDYKTQDFSEILSEFDAVFDTFGGDVTNKSFKVIKNGGFLVTMAGQVDEELFKSKNISYSQQFTQVNSKRLKAITELVDSNKLKLNIDKEFILDDAAEALEYQKTGHPKGKVIIKIKS